MIPSMVPTAPNMQPLSEDDLVDFLYNYFRVEYSTRLFWNRQSSRQPRHYYRWTAMGDELSPSIARPAKPRVQADLRMLETLIRNTGLDRTFIRGLVVRFSRQGRHQRLDKQLCESGRVDLLVRKALKEAEIINMLWPSGANEMSRTRKEQHGWVKRWHGDMCARYFERLHGVDDFALKPAVGRMLLDRGAHFMLIPEVDHLEMILSEVPLATMVRSYIPTGPSPPYMETFDAVLLSNPPETPLQELPNSPCMVHELPSPEFPSSPPSHLEIHIQTPYDHIASETHRQSRSRACSRCGTEQEVIVTVVNDPVAPPTYDSVAEATSGRLLTCSMSTPSLSSSSSYQTLHSTANSASSQSTLDSASSRSRSSSVPQRRNAISRRATLPSANLTLEAELVAAANNFERPCAI